jgi:hypothetical protein
MGSVIPPNPGVSAVDQTLFNELSPPPKMRAASQNASTHDLVHLSDEALQLQEANGLSGASGAKDPGALNINSSNVLETIDALLLGLTPTSSTALPMGGGNATGALFGVGGVAGLANPTINLLA